MKRIIPARTITIEIADANRIVRKSPTPWIRRPATMTGIPRPDGSFGSSDNRARLVHIR